MIQTSLYLPLTKFVLQNQNSRRVIDVGKQQEKLYLLKGVALANACKQFGDASSVLWHRRMGHPSTKVLELIYSVCNFK